MADLIAQGVETQHRWRRTLNPRQSIVIGRDSGAWAVPWDNRISRRHVELCWQNGRLEGKRVAGTPNPVFVRGRNLDQFSLKPGEHFVIGQTTFTLADERIQLSADDVRPVTEHHYPHQFLQQVRYRNADQRIEVLSHLPEIIQGATSDSEMLIRLTNMLLTGIPRASAAAIVAVPLPSLSHAVTPAPSAPLFELPSGDEPEVKILHWDRRLMSGEEFAPSGRLIRRAIDRQESVVHVWSGSSGRGAHAFTESENIDWAFCTPIPGASCRGWAIYVAGSFAGTPADSHLKSRPAGSRAAQLVSDPSDLRDDLKFTELAATTLSNLREVKLLERNQTKLQQFFSPVVLEALAGQDPDEVLAPRQAEVSVLFCDLRGFSRSSEQAADDLLGLLNRVSRALGVMTAHILDQGGVVGDFHGDAAMGFWGWPLHAPDSVTRACAAALQIRTEFEQAASRDDHPLTNFRMGIGIATGPAVAGKIGTPDQVKVTVFGPVVNRASRLENMTKILRAPILLDEVTAEAVRQTLSPSLARIRRVARVKPYGMNWDFEVSELLPPEDQSNLKNSHVAAYEQALDALLQRDWARAFELLHEVPAEDRVKDFLTVFIAQHNRTPPDDWDGVIPLAGK